MYFILVYSLSRPCEVKRAGISKMGSLGFQRVCQPAFTMWVGGQAGISTPAWWYLYVSSSHSLHLFLDIFQAQKILHTNCEVSERLSLEIKTSPVAVLHCSLVLALRIHLDHCDHVKPGLENLFLKKTYIQFVYFFLQISQVLGMRTGTEERQIK